MPDTQQKLIKEALKRLENIKPLFENGSAEAETLKAAISDELSLIARKSGEEGRKQGVAQAVSLFMGKIKSLSQDVLLEALANPKEL